MISKGLQNVDWVVNAVLTFLSALLNQNHILALFLGFHDISTLLTIPFSQLTFYQILLTSIFVKNWKIILDSYFKFQVIFLWEADTWLVCYINAQTKVPVDVINYVLHLSILIRGSSDAYLTIDILQSICILQSLYCIDMTPIKLITSLKTNHNI